jgi:hypothetical protein
MARIYDWAGDDLSADAERSMRDYVAANPQDRHGRHTYTLPAALDRGALEERFAPYRERFAIAREDVS